MSNITQYDNLIKDVSLIIDEAEKLKVVHENIEPIKQSLLKGLKQHRNIFKYNASRAKELSEWDKYTIAFFGETNAGKSTIIEALRILGKEKSKLAEYDRIEAIQLVINNSNKDIEQITESLDKAENTSNENLIKCHQSLDIVNAGTKLNTEQKEKILIAISNIENDIAQTKESLNEANKKHIHIEKQKVLSTKKISAEEKRIVKKELSAFFKFQVWVANVFGYDKVVNTKTLLLLKENDVNIKQALDDINESIHLLSNKNGTLEDNHTNTSHQLQVCQTKIEELLYEFNSINKKQKDFILQLDEISCNIADYKSEKTKLEQLIYQKKLDLIKLGDGKIIGTGKQDFTTDVNSYELEYNKQPLVLIDVPGIEGNEESYTEMIKNAVSKAHAIFYVNGSNKKPEEKTLEKIKTYLQDQTEVYSISNVKGKADTYEFDDERESLSKTHKDLNKTVALTKETLLKVLGSNTYKGHLSVQGLLAFTGVSKYILPERNDLVRNKKKFLNHFKTSNFMIDFSNINSIESLIIEQQPFCKYKIQVANLQTIIGTSNRFTEDLQKLQEEKLSNQIISQINREIKNYQSEVESNLIGLEHSIKNIATRITNQFYNQLRAFFHHIIDKEYDDAHSLYPVKDADVRYAFSRIKRDSKDKQALERAFEIFTNQISDNSNKEFQSIINIEIKKFFEVLQNKKQRISTRLSKINSNDNFNSNTIEINFDFDTLTNGLDFKSILKEGFNFVTTVGGMAMTGAGLGSVIPGLGNAIGAIVGAIIGAVFYGLKKMFGGESREAKLKREIDPKLHQVKSDLQLHYNSVCKKTMIKVHENIKTEANTLGLCTKGLKDLQSMLINRTSAIRNLVNKLIRDKETIEDRYVNTRLN